MGQVANIIDFPGIHGPAAERSRAGPRTLEYSGLERLMPGAARIRAVGGSTALGKQPSPLNRYAAELIPEFVKRFDPAKQFSMLRDSMLITLVCVAESRIFPSRAHLIAELFSYLLFFLIFCIEEGLYSRQISSRNESAAVVRATLFASSLFERATGIRLSLVPMRL